MVVRHVLPVVLAIIMFANFAVAIAVIGRSPVLHHTANRVGQSKTVLRDGYRRLLLLCHGVRPGGVGVISFCRQVLC